MSKDAKISFRQTIGVMIISAVMIAMGWIIGVITGGLAVENVELKEELNEK